jgi:hypothetical protein
MARPAALAAVDRLGRDAAEEQDPVARLRNLIDERQTETIQILQSWIEDPDERIKA